MLITRRSTYLIACAMAGSKAVGKEDRFWPLVAEDHKPLQLDKEAYERMAKRYNFKRHARN